MNRQDFSTLTLQQGPGAAVTPELVLGLCCWAWAENSGGSNTIPGAGARNNPWDTTYRTPTGTPFNTFGPDGQFHVYNYPTPSVGSSVFWRCVQNGLYPDILACLRNPSATAEDLASCRSLSTWGTGQFTSVVAAARADATPYYAPEVAGSGPADTPPPPLTFELVEPNLYAVTMATKPDGTGEALLPVPFSRFRAATGQGSDPPVDGTVWGTTPHVQMRTGNICLTVTGAPASSTAMVFLYLSAAT